MNWLTGPAVLLSLALNEPLPPSPDEVMALPPELIEQVERDVVEYTANTQRRLDRLVDFMFSDHGLGFSYQDTPTRDAGGTFEAGEGNCMAFSLLFLSMAREAGLEAFPREVNAPQSWRREGGVVFNSGHINVGVDTPSRKVTVDFEPDFMLAQRLAAPFRGRRVSEQRALAHFYNNRAAELVADERIVAASAWADQALSLAPGFAAALNTRGVIDRRLGDYRSAENHFLAALENDKAQVNALFNLVSLYRHLGDRRAMEKHQARLEALKPRDPYFQWELGDYYEKLGQFERARDFYQRAIDRATEPDPLFHASLARVLFELDEPERAERALQTGLALDTTVAGKDLPNKLEFDSGENGQRPEKTSTGSQGATGTSTGLPD